MTIGVIIGGTFQKIDTSKVEEKIKKTKKEIKKLKIYKIKKL